MKNNARRISILDAPSNLGLKPPAEGKEPGVKQMAQAIRSRGLLRRLGAVDAGTVEAPAYHGSLDLHLGIRNADGLAVFAKAITGGAAGMDLALVTGTGPELLTNIEGKKPYVRPEDTVLFGYRWPESEANARPSNPMKSFPLDATRADGIASTAAEAVNYLESAPTLGFWLHLDVDVLSPEWMFAVDSPDPGGLTPEELATLLKTVNRSKRCAGMQITIYDPTLDPDGVCGNRIVETLVLAFA